MFCRKERPPDMTTAELKQAREQYEENKRRAAAALAAKQERERAAARKREEEVRAHELEMKEQQAKIAKELMQQQHTESERKLTSELSR
eukprot:311188-Prymnesium_polylepis.1